MVRIIMSCMFISQLSCIIFLFLLFIHVPFVITSSSSFGDEVMCHPQEHLALLQFKTSFSIHNNTAFHYYETPAWMITSYPKTETWNESNIDCCMWDGVTCDHSTGRVIGLDLSCSWLHGKIHPNNSLFLLSHLQRLNLAYNDFNSSHIPPQFGRFVYLTHLNLSMSFLHSNIPTEMSRLSKLISLDLSYNFVVGERDDYNYGVWIEESAVWRRIVHNLTNLREIVLDGVNFCHVDLRSFMNLSSSLTSLSLSDCDLRGNFPTNIFSLSNLQMLNLGGNFQLKGHLTKSTNIGNSLQNLDISYCNFSGELPASFSNLRSLEQLKLGRCPLINMTSIFKSIQNLIGLSHLDLSSNELVGPIPDFWGNFSRLSHLDLSYNHLTGHLPPSLFNLTSLSTLHASANELIGPIPIYLARPANLISLDLSSNSLNGSIPSWIYASPSLRYLYLDSNQFTGCIGEFQYNSLEGLSLGGNYKLQGEFPKSIYRQINLTVLDISSTNLSGIVHFDMLSELKQLSYIELSNNDLLHIKFDVDANYTFPSLHSLILSSCKLSQFPAFLRNQLHSNLRYLDLSNNQIKGNVPKWLSNLEQINYLNLSHNFLTSIEQFPWKNLATIDLHSNLLEGEIPIPLSSTRYLLISNNKFSGEISSLICNTSTYLEVLDLSNNSLSGSIPQCLTNLTSLSVLDLRMNILCGTFPRIFSKGNALTTLDLNGNQIEGPLPKSLAHCKNLEVLDLGNNKMNGIFPHWLETHPNLQILILRSNEFHGSIDKSKTAFSFPKLNILDLSHNNFNGTLPAGLFKSLKAMIIGEQKKVDLKYMGDDVYYKNSVKLTMKGLEMELERIIVTLRILDLSSNNFTGQIPTSIGELKSLIGLNLSHNHLGGGIPPSFGNLKSLEWLDLSSNILSGKIPDELVDLTFLSQLNLSQNQLSGPIPRGNQFDTFDDASFRGNIELCGVPLSKACYNDEERNPPLSTTPQLEEDLRFGDLFEWESVFIGYGCGIAFGLFLGYLVFLYEKPTWLVAFIERRKPNRKMRRRRRTRT